MFISLCFKMRFRFIIFNSLGKTKDIAGYYFHTSTPKKSIKYKFTKQAMLPILREFQVGFSIGSYSFL